MPGLEVEEVRKADFSLECLNVGFSILLEKNALCMTSRTFITLAKTIIKIINDCIQSSCGRVKETAADVLALMGKLQNFSGILDDSSKAELWLEVSSCNPIVFLYSIEILPLNLDMNELSLELAWMWSCITKDINFYEDKIATCGISYISLLNILIPLLCHSSKSEWLDSAHFIKIYFKHTENKREATSYENMSWVFPRNNSSTYLVFTSLLDCLHFILLDKPTEIAYIISCFSNTVMSILKEETLHSHSLMNIFLDVCHLVSITEFEKQNLFSNLLLDLKKSIFLNCKKNEKSNYENLLDTAVKRLPDSFEKTPLLQKMSG
ncbi:hypothetical protein X975_13576, partial [Stegodyphus mimosarum]